MRMLIVAIAATALLTLACGYPKPDHTAPPTSEPELGLQTRIVLREEGSGVFELQLPEGEWLCKPNVEYEGPQQQRQEQPVLLAINPQVRPGEIADLSTDSGWQQLPTGRYAEVHRYTGDGWRYRVSNGPPLGLIGRSWKPHERAPVEVIHALPDTRWVVECLRAD